MSREVKVPSYRSISVIASIGTVFNQPGFQTAAGLTHILFLTLCACDKIHHIGTLAIQVFADDMIFTSDGAGEIGVFLGVSNRSLLPRMKLMFA